jgi:TonB-linked SusC/RagA family outer membrane protein
MRKMLMLMLLWGCISIPAIAQEKIVSGLVTGTDNRPLPDVTVTVKGTNIATKTSPSGTYSIRVAPGQYLVFTSVNYGRVEERVGSGNMGTTTLQKTNKDLDEVIVTALDIRRSPKSLTYAAQSVEGEALAETGRTNFINALQGRVAGLSIGSTGGLPGSSSSIVLRGGTSFDGNNQPLFIVDGIPVDNSTLAEGSLLNDAANRGSDYSNRIGDLDPNDIESITVLKGPSATALYGIDAANGALVITTKKGRKGAMKVSYNNNFRFEKSTRFPERQTMYGTGTLGRSNDSTISHWGGLIGDRPIYDNVENFFKTGFLNSHNLNISGGSDLLSTNISLANLSQDGTVPNTGYDRRSIRMNLASTISPKLKFNGSANYIFSKNKKGTKGANSFYYYSLIWPITKDIRNWQTDNGERVNLLDVEDAFDNPLFDLNRNGSSDDTKRLLLNGSASYDVTDWFNITGRIGYDEYTTNGLTYYDPLSNQSIPNKANAKAVGGIMLDYVSQFRLLNSYLLLNFKKQFGNINAALTTGLNGDKRESRTDSRYGERFSVPGLISINNVDRATVEAATRGYRRNLIGVFGDLKLDYKNYLFLNVTGRNDWSSTLPTENNSFFYPSVGVGFVFTDVLKPSGDIFNYGKLRASFAQVGKDAPPHKFNPALNAFTRTGGGFAVSFFGPNPNIRPETTTSYEIGGEFRFLKSKLKIDATYYEVRSKDQIVSPRLSYASGYILQLVNSGTMQNKGFELLVTGNPVTKKDFSWEVIANFFLNRNKVLALPGGFSEFYLSDTWLAGNVRAGYVPGQSYYSFTGVGYQKNADGKTIIGANGYPLRDGSFHFIGSREPNFNLGLTNVFKYKNLGFRFLWDWKNGGDIFNATDYSLTSVGLSPRTLQRGNTIVFDGVDAAGNPNTQQVLLSQAYFQSSTLGGLNESNFIEKDIYWFRLRDISLSYTLPTKMLGKSFVKGADLNAGVSNLVLISNYTGADPDVNGLNASNRGSGAVGFDYFSLPAPVAFQIGLNLRF